MEDDSTAAQLHVQGGRLLDVDTGSIVDNPGIGIVGERIVAIGTDATTSPLSARVPLDPADVVLPGLVNLHEHFTYRALFGRPRVAMESDQNRQVIRAVRNAHLSLARGITTVRELGSRHGINTALRDAITEGAMVGPRVFSAGSPLSITGGHAWYLGREVDGVEQVRAAVRLLAKEGADWVKIMASHDPVDPTGGSQASRAQYTSAELGGIVEEAHAAGLKATAHAMGTLAIQRCLEAGVDSIEHGVYLTRDQAVQMRELGTVLVPTISSYRRTLWPVYRRGNEWSRLHAMLVDDYTTSTALAIEAGVTIGIGTDSIGEFVEEMDILVELGMSPAAAIRSATRVGADLLGCGDNVGSVAVGSAADLLIVSGDPLEDVGNLREIRYVIRTGALYGPDDFQVSLASVERAPGL
jgi:imidazolonepropionase-like amidohydrolase